MVVILVVAIFASFAAFWIWLEYRNANPPHHHRWEEISRGYSVPRAGKIKTYDNQTLKEFYHGRTTILLRCDECGDETYRSFAGKVE